VLELLELLFSLELLLWFLPQLLDLLELELLPWLPEELEPDVFWLFE